MKKVILTLLIPIFFLGTSFKNDKAAYQIYNSNGKAIKFKNLVKEALEADVVFFGELHNNPICHWLQLELTKSLYAEKKDNLILGAEMFEADNQLLLNEYLTGKISVKNFEQEARIWPNYKTDYKPLVEFAKENQLNFIASNIPRRYASMVNKKGLEVLNNLSTEAKSYIATLPIKYNPELKAYKNMMDMMKHMKHASENLPKAQAIKDATMARFIYKNFETGKLFIHYNGTYHSDNFESTVWYLKQLNPNLKILTIASKEQENIQELSEESKAIANYILVIPDNMTKTH